MPGESCILCFHDFPDESSHQQIAAEEWVFTEILDKREIILDFSYMNTSKSCLFHVFIAAPAKKLHHAMDKSHSATIPLVTRNRSDYRAQILVIFYHFLTASSPQTTRFGQSITCVLLYVLRQWHLHFCFYWKYILLDISGLHLFCFVFIGIISLGASRIFSDQQIQVAFFFFLTVVYNWWISSISWTFVLIPKTMTLHSELVNLMLFFFDTPALRVTQCSSTTTTAHNFCDQHISLSDSCFWAKYFNENIK